MPQKNKLVEARGITVVAEGTEAVLLSNIDFTIRQGEWIAVVGRSGSGKSTLAKALAGLMPVSKGTVLHDLGKVKTGPLLQLVLQNPESQMVGETVYEDVCFGMENEAVAPAEMEARAEQALALTGLSGLERRLTRELSGGQKQLLAVAGALAMKAQAIVFDESTSMLDPDARDRLLQVAASLQREGTAVVWVTQLLDELSYADRVFVLEEGTMVYEGDVRRFFYGSLAEGKAGKQSGPASGDNSESWCDHLGFTPPFVVETAKLLLGKGFALNGLPLTPEELAQAAASEEVGHDAND